MFKRRFTYVNIAKPDIGQDTHHSTWLSALLTQMNGCHSLKDENDIILVAGWPSAQRREPHATDICNILVTYICIYIYMM